MKKNILFQNINNRDIFINDNLNIIQKMEDKIIDLIYLDPPFGNMLTWEAKNKKTINEIKEYFLDLQETKNLFLNEDFEEVFKDVHFDDTWKETDINKSWQEDILKHNEKLFHFIDSIDFVIKGGKYYLFYIAIRLIELKRILKDTGSIYLHCDNTMGHYLKNIMDIIFGYDNFRNSIVWNYRKFSQSSVKGRHFEFCYDNILCYVKDKKTFYNPIYIEEEIPLNDFKKYGIQKDEKGYFKTAPTGKGKGGYSDKTIEKMDSNGLIYWTKNKIPRKKYYLENDMLYIYDKKMLGNAWSDIKDMMHVSKNERVGYPTQKPLDLLERIIKANSNEGDVILDPFCGCATTLISAESLGRKWIGIDQNKQAFYMNYYRFHTFYMKQLRITKEKKEEIFDFDNNNKFSKTIKKHTIEKKDISYILSDLKKRKDLPILKDKEKNKKKDEMIKKQKKIDKEYKEYLKEQEKILTGKQKEEFRKELAKKQNNTCKICKTKLFDNFHLDRIIPGKEGGKYIKDNLQILCANCNLTKGNKNNIDLIEKLYKDKKIDEEVYQININRELK